MGKIQELSHWHHKKMVHAIGIRFSSYAYGVNQKKMFTLFKVFERMLEHPMGCSLRKVA